MTNEKSKFDGMWGREIRAQETATKSQSTTEPMEPCPTIAYPVHVEPEPGYEGVACILDSNSVLIAAMMHPAHAQEVASVLNARVSPAGAAPVVDEDYALDMAVGEKWLLHKPAAERVVARIADNDCLTCKHWSADAVYAIAVELATAATAAPQVDEHTTPDEDDPEDIAWERQSTVSAIAYEFMKLFGVTTKDGWTHDQMRPKFDAAREIITRTFPVLAELYAPVEQKQPLPDHYLCIAPDEQPTVINFMRGYGTDEHKKLAQLHLNLCLRCQELASAAPCGAANFQE